MKRGHCTGIKRERKGSQDWYKERQEELLRQIEAQWAQRQQHTQPKTA
jgi:hypothetical protein